MKIEILKRFNFSDGLLRVSGVEGSTVELPCNITSPQVGINQSINQVINKSIHQKIKQPINQLIT